MGEASQMNVETVSSGDDAKGALSGLKSDKSSLRLRLIADLRARGIGDHIGLPQLAVFGDQSSGKSSVLEGLTGLPFPRGDGLCTTFATEIVFIHSEEPTSLTASIIPSNDRSEGSKDELRQYSRTIEDFVDLPSIIREVAILIGVAGAAKVVGAPAFAKDILRIHVTGRSGLYLTIVDLPGLISVPNDDQTDSDVEDVHALVDSYCKNERTIILAVVQAPNDIANQAIIKKSRKFDPEGVRTVGIITKPDMVNKGTEPRIAMLARNEDTTKLRLGFYLVANPPPEVIEKGFTASERDQYEHRILNTPPWSELRLNRDRVGIHQLREFLQQLLDEHIEKEMPSVQAEIVKKLQATKEDLEKLGEERSTEAQERIFRPRLAMRFNGLTTAALKGDYGSQEAVFFKVGQSDAKLSVAYMGDDDHEDKTEQPSLDHDCPSTRLRAFVHNANAKFANDMREYGHTLLVSDVARKKRGNGRCTPKGQIVVSQDEMTAFVRAVYHRTRGQELPGTQNHVLLTELFHHDSKRWEQLATDHVDSIGTSLQLFVQQAVHHMTSDPRVRKALLQQIDDDLLKNRAKAANEIRLLCEDKDGIPITYNHYFTDNVQKARTAKTREAVKKALRTAAVQDYSGTFHISNIDGELEKLVNVVQQKVNVDMDDQACSEARDALEAYYRVARKTFVDNVCIQVIERHLLKNLPVLFSPDVVAGWTKEETASIAGEDRSIAARRKELQSLVASLEGSLRDLRQSGVEYPRVEI